MKKNQSDVNRFWARFRDIVIKFNIPDSQADLYVKWATNFALSIKGKPLKERKLEDVKAYLANLKEQKDINEIQIEQARKALYLLYYKFLKVPLDFSENESTGQEFKIQKDRCNEKQFLEKLESSGHNIEDLQYLAVSRTDGLDYQYQVLLQDLKLLTAFNNIEPSEFSEAMIQPL